MGRWVIIATERWSKPSDFKQQEYPNGDVKTCPFCPGNEAQTPPEILAYHHAGRHKNKSGWWLRVVPNKFPALQVEGEIKRQGDGMYDRMNGIGAHEVIIETPEHFALYGDMDNAKVEDIFWAFKDRITDLKKDPRIQYVLIFKNHGKTAGASLSHPHSQLIATPMVPIRVRQEMDGAQRYYEYKERCVFCDIVSEELLSGKRIVGENNGFLAFEPYAGRFPFETWIIPKLHTGHFEEIQKPGVAELAVIMKSVLAKMNRALNNPPFNYIIHSTPVHEAGTAHYHWHIEIMPKLTHVAGFEWGSGFYINPVAPELAAKFLNEAS